MTEQQDRPHGSTQVWVLLVGGMMAVITGAVTAFLTYYLGQNAWQTNADYQGRTVVLQKRLDLIERTAQLTGRAAGMSDLWDTYLREIKTTVRKSGLPSHDPALSTKLGEYNGDFKATLALDALFFGPKTRAAIAQLHPTADPQPYWNIPPEKMEQLISAMAAELQSPPVSQPGKRQ